MIAFMSNKIGNRKTYVYKNVCILSKVFNNGIDQIKSLKITEESLVGHDNVSNYYLACLSTTPERIYSQNSPS